ncbi:ubiquitin-related domain-containing protein [Cercophora scortea]|uniref:Ubiquitin-like protein ATG12 n=1 Tax=Cercophora scortea TaxID=314031 RepID=A0AAE0IYU0_9PEZI|nr:ubiquitin-related domain-containing protein [Cercophora scortea]
MAFSPPPPSTNTAAGFPAGPSASDTSPPASPELEGRDSPDLPLTMSASTVLMSLPRDATAALAEAGSFAQEKVVLRFKPVGGTAPPLRQEQWKLLSSLKFERVVILLRSKLKVKETDSVFLYVNSTFAPALDEVIGNLWTCFKDSSNQLNISYSMTPAFG